MSGPVVHMDFSNQDSYPGTGNTLFNLIENSSFSMSVEGTYSGDGVFYKPNLHTMSGNSDITAQTIVVRIKKVSHIPGSHFVDLRPNGVELWFHGTNVNGNNDFFNKVYMDGVLASIDDLGTFPSDQWIEFTLVSTTPFTDNVNLFSSMHGGPAMDVEISTIIMYDRPLTDAEVLSNSTSVATSMFSASPGPINIRVDVDDVPDAVALKLTYQSPTGSEITAFSEFLSGSKNVESLDPEVEYTMRLYVDSGSGYELGEEKAVTTLANSAANYVIDDFVQDGKNNLDGLNTAARTRMSAVMNDLFTTGDKISVSVGSKRGNMEAKFVNRGGTTRVSAADALLLPFDTESGAAQTISLQMSDDSTKVVTYNDAANTISVDSVDYSPGDFFVVDGQKCTVFEY